MALARVPSTTMSEAADCCLLFAILPYYSSIVNYLLYILTVMVRTNDRVLFVPYGYFLIYVIHLFYST
jgi:hypothetical protein